MDTESIEYLLSSYFNEIVWVDENPAKLVTSKTFKENGKIITSNSEEYLFLDNLLIDSLEDINKFLFKYFIDCNSIDLNFYPKNIISKFFRLKSKKLLLRHLSTLNENNYIITSDEIYKSYLNNLGYTVYLSDEFKDKIIVGTKNRIIIHKNIEEFYLDKKDFLVINLK